MKVLFNAQSFEAENIDLEGMVIEPYQGKKSEMKSDIMFVAKDIKGELVIKMDYKSNLFSDESMKLFMEDYEKILNHIAEGHGGKIADIELSKDKSADEKLMAFNDDFEDFDDCF